MPPYFVRNMPKYRHAWEPIFSERAAARISSSGQQILADYTSVQTRIPAEFWTELKAQQLIEQNTPTPA
jgi:hypothetical protein